MSYRYHCLVRCDFCGALGPLGEPDIRPDQTGAQLRGRKQGWRKAKAPGTIVDCCPACHRRREAGEALALCPAD